MRYVEENLIEGERVMHTARRHWIVIAGPVILSGLLALPGLAVLFNKKAWFAGVIILAIAACLLLWGWFRRNAFEFAVTNKRLIYRKGIVSVATDELFLEKIESVLVKQGLLGRWMGYGSVSVRGTGGSWEPFSEIDNPLLPRRRIQEQMERRTVLVRTPPPSASAS